MAVSILRLSFERAFRRALPGNARLTRLDSRADKLEVERVLPCKLFVSQRVELRTNSNERTVELLVELLPRLSKTYGGGA